MEKKNGPARKIFAFVLAAFLLLNLGWYVTKLPLFTRELQTIWEKDLPVGRKIFDSIQEVETLLTRRVWKHDSYVDLYGLTLRAVGKRIMEDADPTYHIYRMKNDQLTFNYEQMDVTEAVSHTQGLYQYCKDSQISFLYVQLPYKVNKYDNQLPDGYVDGANRSADQYLALLRETGIPCMDYREVMQERGDYAQRFYNGDHHWKEETAFTAYLDLMERMRSDLGITLDERAMQKENFLFETYENSFIGSQLNRTGNLFTNIEPDDFTVITPAYDEDAFFTREVYKNGKAPELRETLEGSFSEAILAKKALARSSQARTGRHSVYLGHNPCLDIIRNRSLPEENAPNGELLVLEDSFSTALSSFCSLQFPAVHIVDLRHFHVFLTEYLKEHPQIRHVVVSYAASDFKPGTYTDFFSMN